MKDNLKIPYGVADFKSVCNEGLYYVDKTSYIRALEDAGRFLFFVRPRRFGKSLFASMLRCYYDISEKENFASLFGGLDIGANPTENANRYQILYMDFSQVNICEGETLRDRFANYIGVRLRDFLARYESQYGSEFSSQYPNASAEGLFSAITSYAHKNGYHLYLILDEYDNFTNAMLRSEGNFDYRSITHGQGFYREWFKGFKGNFDRIFMTGVSPVTMDDLTSGFNIASNISQLEMFNAMLGFSEDECLRLYTDFKGTGRYLEGEPSEWVAAIKPWYDGYCFADDKRGEESVFNSDMALYFLLSLVDSGKAPEDMVRSNIDEEYARLLAIEKS